MDIPATLGACALGAVGGIISAELSMPLGAMLALNTLLVVGVTLIAQPWRMD